MGSMQRISFSWVGDEFFQISACIKFEIKKLEAQGHWIMHAEYYLTAEHLIRLKVIYTTLAQYYERLTLIDLSINKVKSCAVLSPNTKALCGGISKSTLLESYKILQEVKRDMIMTDTRSDKISFMLRMSELCREFSVLLEEYLKCDETLEVKTECPDTPSFSSKAQSIFKPASNGKLESLFRALEK